MAVTKAEILSRLRERLHEPTADLWSDDELTEWYDTGASYAHEVICAMAKSHADSKGIDLLSVNHQYFRQFLGTPATGNTVAGTAEYALPADFWKYVARVSIGTAPNELIAIESPASEQFLVTNYPQFGPTPRRPLYSIIPARAAATAKLRLYMYGDNTIPNEVTPYTIEHIRDVTRTTGVNVDLLDPYNYAPIAYACALAMAKERTSQAEFLREFELRVRATVYANEAVPIEILKGGGQEE